MRQQVRYAFLIPAILLVLLGAIWILQGIDVLPGSFMTGQMQWAYRGGVCLLVGLALLVFARRRN
jgi:hypothetical protein